MTKYEDTYREMWKCLREAFDSAPNVGSIEDWITNLNSAFVAVMTNPTIGNTGVLRVVIAGLVGAGFTPHELIDAFEADDLKRAKAVDQDSGLATDALSAAWGTVGKKGEA